MKPTLKILFTDMWGYDQYTFNSHDNYFFDLLSTKFNVVVDNNPDLLIFSCFGDSNKNYNCKKIYFCGENIGPNFKHPSQVQADITLTHFENSNTNYYFPLWVLFVDWFDKDQPRPLPSNPTYSIPIDKLCEQSQEKINIDLNFCCFINNNPVPDRIELFNKLNDYKRVDSYGNLYNNMGSNLRGSEYDKINTLKNYKFTIAYENSYHHGYNTEKIIQPLSVKCIPIYSGGAQFKEYINKDSIIYANEYNNVNDLVEYIIKVDQNETLYSNIISQYNFIDNKPPECFKPEIILNWICNKLHI